MFSFALLSLLSLVLPATLVTYLLWRVLQELLLSPYRDVPGPFLAKFTRLWEVLDMVKGRPDLTLRRLHAEHGPVVRIGPNKFSFDEPADAAIIYGLNSGFHKTEFYKGIADPNRTSIFSTRDEVFHAERKRKIASLYSMSNMVHYEPAVDSMIALALRQLSRKASEKTLLSVDRFMQYFAFDVVARLTFDQEFGMVERMSDYKGIIAIIEKLLRISPLLATIPESLPWVFWMTRILRTKSPGAELTAWIRNAIAEARQNWKGPQKGDLKAEAFVVKCLNLEAEGKIDPESIMDACAANISAGSDTTGSTLTAIIYHLFSNPDSLAALHEEISTARANGTISTPVTFSEAQSRLPYLNAVIKEGLRLSPAIGHILPRVTPLSGAKLAGRNFPGGVEVACGAPALHLNERYHGADCKVWQPERWIESKELEKDAVSRIGSQFTFGGGSRICLGKNISLLEMTKFLPEVVMRFDFEFEKAPDGNVLPPNVKTAFFTWLRYNCYVNERTA